MLEHLYADHLQTVRARTDDALARCGFDSLAIFAGRAPMMFLDDQGQPFKVNPHFKYWLPLLDAPDSWVLYRPGQPLELLFLQPIDYWYKPPETPSGYWTSHFQIKVIREPRDAKPHLSALANCAFIGEWQEEFATAGSMQRNPAALLEQLHYPRAMKTPYEVECMRRASKLGVAGHRAAKQAFDAGGSEYDIHQAFVRGTGLTEHELPYANIVALNANSATLHYQNQEREAPAQRLSFLIDAGAQFSGYASDITRTYSAQDDEFRALIAGVDRLQQKLCRQVRSGVDYADIHLAAHREIATLLREVGIITLDPETAVASGLSGVFFPHGIGHLLGLQVHDVSGFSVNPQGKQKEKPAGHPYLRLTRTLEPGFVVTIEPGVYFIDALLDGARTSAHARHIAWQRVEKLQPYGGIRVEDNVACTSGEPENLTRAAFAAAS
jgi:Xaa-Pro dipeptidase